MVPQSELDPLRAIVNLDGPRGQTGYTVTQFRLHFQGTLGCAKLTVLTRAPLATLVFIVSLHSWPFREHLEQYLAHGKY